MGRPSKDYKGNEGKEKMKKEEINLGDVANPDFLFFLTSDLTELIGEPDKIVVGFKGITPEYCVLIYNKRGEVYAIRGNIEKEEVTKEDLKWLGIDIGKYPRLESYIKPLLLVWAETQIRIHPSDWEYIKVSSPEELESLEKEYSHCRTVFLL